MNLYRVIYKNRSGTRTRYVEARNVDEAMNEIESEDDVINYISIEIA